MIAENVVFVGDDDGHNYYIPKDKLDDFNRWVEDFEMDDVPDYAIRFEGEIFVVNIIEEL